MLMKKVLPIKVPVAKAPASKEWDFELSATHSIPPSTLIEYSALYYGEAGVGKTEMVSELGLQFGGKVFFFTWEPSSEGIAAMRSPLLNNEPSKNLFGWRKAQIVAEKLEKDAKKNGIVAVCFDTVRPAFDSCLSFVCNREGIGHPGEMKDYGASWGKVTDEYKLLNDYLRGLGLAVIAIAHEKVEEIETRAGKKFCVVKPAISGSCEAYYRSTTAIIGYYYMLNGERWMQVIADDYVTAKCPSKYFHTSSGERVERIPMGRSAKESAKNFLNAFNNKQTEVYPSAEGGIVHIKEQNAKTGKFDGKAKKVAR
jgi:AAA domain